MLDKELEMKAAVDIRAVDVNDLVDIEKVDINSELPVQERITKFVDQVKNPYCYLNHGMIVKVSFAGKKKLEDCIKDCAFS